MNTNTLRQLFTFQSIFDGLEDAVICHDIDLIITNWNLAAERMFGYTSDEVLDANMSELLLIAILFTKKRWYTGGKSFNYAFTNGFS